ncbi:MAG: hypothetical protein Kow00121_41260 [Elainellaceae cyanobacterium]
MRIANSLKIAKEDGEFCRKRIYTVSRATAHKKRCCSNSRLAKDAYASALESLAGETALDIQQRSR